MPENTNQRNLEIVELTPSDLSEMVVNKFLERGTWLSSNKSLEIEDFDALFMLPSPDQIATYGASHQKSNFGPNEPDDTCTYVLHIDQNEAIAGMGEMMLSPKDRPFFKDKPFVVNTYTKLKHQRNGYGRRRLIEMHTASLALHGLPLYSGTIQSRNAKSLWKHLVEDGMADKFTELPESSDRGTPRERYVMRASST